MQRLLLTTFSFVLFRSVFAQVSVMSLSVDPLAVSLATFPGISVSNPSEKVEVIAELVISSSNGEQEATLISAPFTVGTGVQVFNTGSLVLQSFTAAPTERGRQLLRMQRLAGGAHECCVTLRASASGEEALPFCEQLMVEEELFLDLVEPWDGDTIEDTRPMLAWTAFGAVMNRAEVDLRLVIVGNDDGGKARALASQVPLFAVDHLKQPTVPFPAGQPDLLRGHCYAWQVEAWMNNALVTRTEPWRFCVRKTIGPVPEKYVLLRTDGGKSLYEVVDGLIYFRTDERYKAEELQCSILSNTGEREVPEVMRENAGQEQAGVKAVGVNLYELDVQPYHLKNGSYRLEVLDAKGRRYVLKFNYVK